MARPPRRAPGPLVLNEADMPEVDRIMDEVGIPVHSTTEELLKYLSRQSGGIPDFARDALVRSYGLDPKIVQEAHNHGARTRPVPRQPEEARSHRARENPAPIEPEADDDFDNLTF